MSVPSDAEAERFTSASAVSVFGVLVLKWRAQRADTVGVRSLLVSSNHPSTHCATAFQQIDARCRAVADGAAGAVRMSANATVLEFQRDWENNKHYNDGLFKLPGALIAGD